MKKRQIMLTFFNFRKESNTTSNLLINITRGAIVSI